MDSAPRIILAMSPADPSFSSITCQLAQLGTTLRTATTVREARALIRPRDQGIVISGVTLPDGGWLDLLAYTVQGHVESRFLVCCATPDERLWSEVIWHGGHDVLVEPFDLIHLSRTLGLHYPSRDADNDPELAGLTAHV